MSVGHCPWPTCVNISNIKINDESHEHDAGRALFTVSIIMTAPRHCLNDHMIITSGASRARHIKKIRRFSSGQFFSSSHGTLGCTDTLVIANVVARQIHMMSQTDRLGVDTNDVMGCNVGEECRDGCGARFKPLEDEEAS